MKKTYFVKIALVGLICVGAALVSGDAFAAGGDAKLTIGRSPKLGSGTNLSVSIDGKRIGAVGTGSPYSGSIPAGKHTLTVAFDPARGGDKPFSLEINATAGQTYGYIATIQHGDLVLTKNK